MREPMWPGTLVVILDGGPYYGRMAEFQSFTSNGISANARLVRPIHGEPRGAIG